MPFFVVCHQNNKIFIIDPCHYFSHSVISHIKNNCWLELGRRPLVVTASAPWMYVCWRHVDKWLETHRRMALRRRVHARWNMVRACGRANDKWEATAGCLRIIIKTSPPGTSAGSGRGRCLRESAPGILMETLEIPPSWQLLWRRQKLLADVGPLGRRSAGHANPPANLWKAAPKCSGAWAGAHTCVRSGVTALAFEVEDWLQKSTCCQWQQSGTLADKNWRRNHTVKWILRVWT